MSHQLPPIQNISALSFQDYVRIRRLVDHEGKLPTIEVTQHDKDTVTFYDAYAALKDLANDSHEYAMNLNEYTTNLVSSLCSLLVSHKLLSEKEVAEIGNFAEKLWKENRGKE